MATFTVNKKGGYEMAEVDSYIKNLEQQLNEYKNKSTAINKAIISAQVASDNMIKATQSEADALIKRAKDDANAIKKQAEDEKAKIIEEAKNAAAELRKGTKSQLTEIKASISDQREMVSDLSKDYNAVINKLFNSGLIEELTKLKNQYSSSSYNEAVKNIQSKLDEIDSMADDLGEGKKISSEPVKPASVNSFMNRASEEAKPAPQQTASPVKAVEPVKSEERSAVKPITASFSSAKPVEAKSEDNSFVKTNLNASSAMNGIPVQKSYDNVNAKPATLNSSSPTKPGIYRVPVSDKK